MRTLLKEQYNSLQQGTHVQALAYFEYCMEKNSLVDDLLGFGLAFMVIVPQPAIAALAPSVKASIIKNTGTVRRSTGCIIHHLAPQGLNKMGYIHVPTKHAHTKRHTSTDANVHGRHAVAPHYTYYPIQVKKPTKNKKPSAIHAASQVVVKHQ